MSFGQHFQSYAANFNNSQLLLAAAAVAAANSSTNGNKSDPSSAAGQQQSSNSGVSNTNGTLLTNSSESGEMSTDGLRLLASAGGHHGLVAPTPQGPQSLISSVPSSQSSAGMVPPMPPMFAGLPSLDPYRLPPPPFGLYTGGISPAGGPLDLKVPDGMPPPPFAHPNPNAMQPYYFDPAFASGYPYAADRFGNPLDLNGARRKNATRETTAALKAWLYEHRKNPYPTKGEKIMLAIITKMTLTQVSTWFANARRRLKKENKMTWSPRNRPGEDDDGVDGNSTTQENSARPGSSLSSLGDDARDGDDDDVEDLGPDTVAVACNLDEESAKRLIHGSMKLADGDEKSEASGSVKRLAEEASASPKKPKIWSIAETVASPDSSPQKPKPPTESPQHHQQQHLQPYQFTFPPWPHMAAAAAFAGRNPLMPPPNSTAGGAPSFPFAMPPTPFGTPVSISSLPHAHQLRPELFGRNFFAPVPPTAPMMNAAAAAAAATGLPGFLNGFAFGCGPPAFPFGFGLPAGAGNIPNMATGAPAIWSQPPQQQHQQQQQTQHQNGAGNEAGGGSNESASTTDRQECKSRVPVPASSVSPVSSNGGRPSSTSSQEPKANASSS